MAALVPGLSDGSPRRDRIRAGAARAGGRRNTLASMPELTPEMATQFVHQSVPAIGRLGVVVDAISPGSVQLRVPIEGNRNHMGTMYAGALFAVAELPGGLIPLSVLEPGRYVPIVTDMHVRFVAAARTDVRLSARIDPDDLRALAEQADADGQAEFVLALTGQDTEGRVVLATEATYLLRRARG
jgi:acyl-coenzyme A thioesterase PaaI-like protein